MAARPLDTAPQAADREAPGAPHGPQGLPREGAPCMTRAAIYCRKSTAETGKPDEFRSVERQRAACEAFAAARGWEVDPAHVYIDDKVSGAEFGDRRPALARLLNHLSQPPFDVVIVYHRDRLGRETLEVPHLLGRLARAEINVVEVKTGRPVALTSATDKFLASAESFAAEVEREQARTRTTDAMVAKARARHVTGGVCFGYDNVRQPEGHVARVINAREAEVVRAVFHRYADGRGLRSIVHGLNHEGAPAPLPRKAERPRGWSVSSLRAVLRRELYVGRVVWNRSAKRNAWGERRHSARPEAEWITYEAPELQIVPAALWTRVQTRLRDVRATYTAQARGKLWGRPPGAVESRHLLVSLATCAQCGGSIGVHSRSHGSGPTRHTAHFYGCSTHWSRGTSICANALVVPVATAENGILAALDAELFDSRIVTKAMAQLRAALSDSATSARPEAVARELARVEAQVDRLADAIQLGRGEVPVLVERLRHLEARRGELRRERDHLRTVSTAIPTAKRLAALGRDILACLADRQQMCREQPAQARRLLSDALTKRMTWTPHADARGGYYEFTAECSLGRVVTAALQHSKRWWPQRDSIELTKSNLELPRFGGG